MGGTDHLGQPVGKFALRFLFLALLMIAGILGVVVLMQKGQARIVAETAPQTTATVEVKAQQPPDLPSPATPPAMESLQKAPAAMPAPAQVAPSAPGAKLPSKSAEPSPPAFQVIAKPAVTAVGILQTTRGRVTLRDIVLLEPVTMCGTGQSAWPCGQWALTQLRRFLRGRSVTCDIVDPAWQGDVTARCLLGKEDVGAWLVQNGWAQAVPGSAYEAAGKAAEIGKRGIFGSDPRRP